MGLGSAVIALGFIALVVAFVAGSVSSSTQHVPELEIRHLPWKTGVQLSAAEFYGDLKVGIENEHKGTVEHDGASFVLTTTRTNCADVEPVMENLIPNGVELECRTNDFQGVWLLERK